MSKRYLILFVTLALLKPGAALGTVTFGGTVVPGETVSVTAPYGGTIKSIAMREGALISVGDPIAEIATTKVLATEDGTVRGVFAEEGDSADKTVLYLAPVSKYTISASIGKAYSSAATKYVRIGETVHIRCAPDGSHKAVGIITAVNGSDYTVQTTGGELYMEETVYIYRSQGYESAARIGSGTVSRTDAVSVSGSGSLLKMYVSDGDEVERGQLLFETVDGSIDAMTVNGSEILSDAEGVVAEVRTAAGEKIQKGAVLLTVYNPSTYRIKFAVTEDMLSFVKEGDAVSVYFDWNEDKTQSAAGVIREISYMSDISDAEDAQSPGEVTYSGYISFTPDSSVRLGMNVTVSVSAD